MPSAYVQKMADKHDVSLETAERRWAEAKKAVKKGKRRGSWYWGKVMNTFKRMMGEGEEIVTFKDFISENKKAETLPQITKNWPSEAVLSPSSYTLERQDNGKQKKVIYQVRRLLDGADDKHYAKVFVVKHTSDILKTPRILWQVQLNQDDQPQWNARSMFLEIDDPKISDFQELKKFVLSVLRKTLNIQEGLK